MDKEGWDAWFALSNQSESIGQQLNAIKGKIYTNESLLSKESIFIHSLYRDMFTNIDGSIMLKINPYDKSGFLQIGLEYATDDNTLFKSYMKNYAGDSNSEYGSLSNQFETIFEIQYYF